MLIAVSESAFVWHLSTLAGCCKYNSVCYCTKSITFSLSRSDMFSPCMRHLRSYVTSGCKFPRGEQQEVKIFELNCNAICQCHWWHSLPASTNFTILLSSTQMTFSLPSTVSLSPCECSIRGAGLCLCTKYSDWLEIIECSLASGCLQRRLPCLWHTQRAS